MWLPELAVATTGLMTEVGQARGGTGSEPRRPHVDAHLDLSLPVILIVNDRAADRVQSALRPPSGGVCAHPAAVSSVRIASEKRLAWASGSSWFSQMASRALRSSTRPRMADSGPS